MFSWCSQLCKEIFENLASFIYTILRKTTEVMEQTARTMTVGTVVMAAFKAGLEMAITVMMSTSALTVTLIGG